MIVRDLDVLVEAARARTSPSTFSIPTLDEEVWRRTEPSTAHPRQRLEALRELVDAGDQGGVGMAPILPGISDRPEQLAASCAPPARPARPAIWANLLYLKPGTREHFLEHLARDWPEELPRYERLYAAGAPTCRGRRPKPVRTTVVELAREHGIRDRRQVRLDRRPSAEQLALAV